MSKLKPPVFVKPEEPDFIKRLKSDRQESAEAVERPITEAPAREDELPALPSEVSASDLDEVRRQHGLESSSDVSTLPLQIKSSSNPARERLAGVGRSQATQQKRLKQLELLRDKRSLIQDEDDGQSRDTAQTRTTVKKPATKRKKMVVNAS